jgi:hypothetical protein
MVHVSNLIGMCGSPNAAMEAIDAFESLSLPVEVMA